MNKFLRISLMALLALVFNTTFAADAYKTLTFPDENSENNKVQAYTETWEATIGGDSWEIVNFNNNNWNNWSYIKCGRKITHPLLLSQQNLLWAKHCQALLLQSTN